MCRFSPDLPVYIALKICVSRRACLETMLEWEVVQPAAQSLYRLKGSAFPIHHLSSQIETLQHENGNWRRARSDVVSWRTAPQAGSSRVQFPMGSLEIFIDIKSFWSHYVPGVDSASNRNEYQEYFLGGKGGRYLGLTTLPPSRADYLEIWDSQHPGTLYRDFQTCNGTAVPMCLKKIVLLRTQCNVTAKQNCRYHMACKLTDL